MQTLKSIFLGLVKLNFRLLLLTLVPAVALVLTISNDGLLKQELKQAGVFRALTDSAVKGAIENTETGADQEIVQQAVKSALNENFSNQAGDQLIGGLYGWLEGKTPKPEFTIDIKETKQAVVTSVADSTEQRVKQLPPCTFQQLRSLQPDTQLSELPCQPPNINYAAERQKLIDQVNGNANIPDQLSSAKLLAQNPGEDPFENLQAVPVAYQLFKPLLWVMGLTALLCAVIILFVQKPRWQAVRSIGWSLVGAAILSGATLIAFYLILNDSRLQGLSAELKPVISAFINIAHASIFKIYWIFTIAYGVGGGGLVYLARRMRVAAVAVPARRR